MRNIFSDNVIRMDSYVKGADEVGICVFTIESRNGEILFEVKFSLSENKCDFWVIVSNFGIPDRYAAGSKSGILQRLFTHTEAETAKRRIEEYFTGSEKKEFPPFSMSRAVCLGVKFSEQWIIETP